MLTPPILSFNGYTASRDALPVVNSVFVNGQGPYRFLLDTGANLNLIDTTLARSLGMKETSQLQLLSSTGSASVSGSEPCILRTASVEAGGQPLLISDLQGIRRRWPGVQGVLGQAFLSRFDYLIRIDNGTVEFGARPPEGVRTGFKRVNGRMVIPTSLGSLVLDSGADRLVRFGVQRTTPILGEVRTVTGTRQVGLVPSKLVISGRRVWSGDAIALGDTSASSIDGLVPLNLFKAVYICNSGGYVILF